MDYSLNVESQETELVQCIFRGGITVKEVMDCLIKLALLCLAAANSVNLVLGKFKRTDRFEEL